MRVLTSVAFLFAAFATLAAADEADLKPVVKALEKRFEVSKQRFDTAKRQYVFTLMAKETSTTACNFVASFQDADDKELTSVKLEFDDGGKGTAKGQKYTVTVKYPTAKTMEKVAGIEVKKSD